MLTFLFSVWRGDLKDVHKGRPFRAAMIHHAPPSRLWNLETLGKSLLIFALRMMPTTWNQTDWDGLLAVVHHINGECRASLLDTDNGMMFWSGPNFYLTLFPCWFWLGHQSFMSLHERARLQWWASILDNCKCSFPLVRQKCEKRYSLKQPNYSVKIATALSHRF